MKNPTPTDWLRSCLACHSCWQDVESQFVAAKELMFVLRVRNTSVGKSHQLMLICTMPLHVSYAHSHVTMYVFASHLLMLILTVPLYES